MNKIFINATAAKKGGALTILELYCKSKNQSKDYFYIYSPLRPTVMPINSCWIKKETSGIGTLFFSLFFSWFFYRKHECNKLISFSNVNNILPIKNRITYFHNLLILNSEEVKYKILRFVLKNLNQRTSYYIFQTAYVRDLFFNRLEVDVNYDVCWPGVYVEEKKLERIDFFPHSYSSYSKKLVVPITNINDGHKNFELVVKLANDNPSLLFVVTAPKPIDNNILLDNIFYIGCLSRSQYLSLLVVCYGTLIVSKYETVCLPIFESLMSNRPAFVLDSEYVIGLRAMFTNIEGMYTFCDAHDFVQALLKSELENKKISNQIYSSGNWFF